MRAFRDLIGETVNDESRRSPSRRALISRGAIVLAATAASPIMLGHDPALAKSSAAGGKGGKRGNNRGGKGDTAILNYALTLEHLEFAFYRDGLAQFQASDFDAGVFARLQEIRDHEGAHVDALTGVIQQRGGTPVAEACYDFGPNFSDPDGFLGIAQALENTGVMAYDGAIASIKNPQLQTTGATIATVEARHASYLNDLNGDDPFPAAFDTPKSMSEILQIAGQFIVACSSGQRAKSGRNGK